MFIFLEFLIFVEFLFRIHISYPENLAVTNLYIFIPSILILLK